MLINWTIHAALNSIFSNIKSKCIIDWSICDVSDRIVPIKHAELCYMLRRFKLKLMSDELIMNNLKGLRKA